MILNRQRRRTGLTLAELLVAGTVTTLVVTALGVFTRAAIDGWRESSQTGNTTQAGRVVLARIARATATGRQILKISDDPSSTDLRNQVLLVWERDGEPGDPTPGQPNFVELVIYAPHQKETGKLLELRPQVDPALVVPTEQPDLLRIWIDWFRNEQDIEQPPVILLTELGGIHFEVEEYTDPQGIAGAVQQDVRIRLCISPESEQPTVFFGSATRRYVAGN